MDEKDFSELKTSLAEHLQIPKDNQIRLLIEGFTRIEYRSFLIMMRDRNLRQVPSSSTEKALFGCNTAVYLLGSKNDAKVVIIYICPYITKRQINLEWSLLIAVAVHEKCLQYQSSDRRYDQDPEFLKAKLFLQRFCHSLSGKEEINPGQAAGYSIDFPFNQSSCKFVNLDPYELMEHYDDVLQEKGGSATITTSMDIAQDSTESDSDIDSDSDSDFEANTFHQHSRYNKKTSKNKGKKED